MTRSSEETSATPPEQIIYANILVIGVWIGLLFLMITYTLYLSGILTPHVPIDEVPALWGLSVNDYLHTTASPQGWGWMSMIGKGDILNFAGFAFLALITVLCYLVLLRAYLKSKDWLFLVICALEIVVLSVAASGLLGSGGH